MQLAALMLRRGDDVNVVAADTEVPVAMLELLRAELEAAAEHSQNLRWEAYRRRSARIRRTIIVAVSIEVVALANIVACITAFLRHDRGLGLVTGVVAAALMIAVYLIGRPLARTLRPPAADHQAPPPPRRSDG